MTGPAPELPRYRRTLPPPSSGLCRSWFAQDVVLDRAVFLKTGPVVFVLRECRALLAAPPGIAPAVLDLVEDSSGQLVLVEERLEGATLAAPVCLDELPAVALALADALIHLHRARYVHGDIKPENVFVTTDAGVRLLDLGFSWMGEGPRDLAAEAAELGGTPPFAAPEIRLGWAADARADQYSLGMTVRAIAPGADEDRRWSDLLARMTSRSPSRRFPSLIEFRAEVASRFVHPGSSPDARPGSSLEALPAPRFGAGPMRGRAGAVERTLALLEREDGPAVVLIQGMPGSGLTRFLLECLAAHAASVRSGGSPERARRLTGLDLTRDLTSEPGARGRADASALLDHAQEMLSRGHRLLVAVGDPSPALLWPGGDLPASARRRLLGWKSERVFLPPIGAEDLGEIAAHSLGQGGRDLVQLGRALSEGAEGDLRVAARAFAAVVRAAARPAGLHWKLSWKEAESTLNRFFRDEPAPSILDPLPGVQRTSLELLARIARRMPLRIARETLDMFQPGGDLPALLDRGLLVHSGDTIRFATRRLREEALLRPIEGLTLSALELDRWLFDRHHPISEETDAVLEAARRARRLAAAGHPAAAEEAARLIRGSLEEACSARRWDRVLDLLGDGADPRAWTEEEATLRLETLSASLGSTWPPARLLFQLGLALHGQDQEEGARRALARAAEMRLSSESAEPSGSRRGEVPAGSNWSAEAIAQLAVWERLAGRMEEHRRLLARLEEMERSGAGPGCGVLDLERARSARASGRREEAERLGTAAAAALRDSGHPAEVGALIFLAQLRLPEHVDEAIALMRQAVAAAPSAEQRTLARQALAQIHEIRGDLSSFAEWAEEALRESRSAANRRLEVLVRQQCAWAWALLDRAADAAREAQALLDDSLVRAQQPRLAMVHLLAGFAALHAGDLRRALPETAAAWETLGTGGSPKLRASFLRHLVDALLDLGATPAVREFGAALALRVDPGEPSTFFSERRAAALRAEAERGPEAAISILEPHLAAARAHTDLVDAARYLHHLGQARLARATGAAAAEATGPSEPTEPRPAPRVRESRSAAPLAAPDQEEAILAAALFEEALDRLGSTGYGYYRARGLLALSRARFAAGDPGGARATLERTIALARRIGSRGVLAEALRLRVESGLGES